jgi:hypothetical protein
MNMLAASTIDGAQKRAQAKLYEFLMDKLSIKDLYDKMHSFYKRSKSAILTIQSPWHPA